MGVRYLCLFFEDVKYSGGFDKAGWREANLASMGISVEAEIIGTGDRTEWRLGPGCIFASGCGKGWWSPQ
jgi:hypothetical protein